MNDSIVPGDITQMLSAATGGDQAASDALYGQTYDKLKEIAHRQLRRHSAQTLQTTVLVHEAYLKFFRSEHVSASNRAHFYALAARAMRQILVDAFRARQAARRGAALPALELRDGDMRVEQRGAVLLDLDRALEELARLNPRLARVVECRFFGGMTQEETAEALGVTDRTVRSDWRKARAFLARSLAGDA